MVPVFVTCKGYRPNNRANVAQVAQTNLPDLLEQAQLTSASCFLVLLGSVELESFLAMNQHQKRKRRHGRSDGLSSQFTSSWLSSNQEESTRPEDSIYIEAHEADLIMSNAKAAMMLEAPISAAPLEKGAQGSGLVKWEIAGGTEDIWVDRCVHTRESYISILYDLVKLPHEECLNASEFLKRNCSVWKGITLIFFLLALGTS